MIKSLIKKAKEKYNIVGEGNVGGFHFEIKFDYFTISIGETLKDEIQVKLKRGNNGAEGIYSKKIMKEMFKNNEGKILDFIIFRTIEYYYTQKCKSLL